MQVRTSGIYSLKQESPKSKTCFIIQIWKTVNKEQSKTIVDRKSSLYLIYKILYENGKIFM